MRKKTNQDWLLIWSGCQDQNYTLMMIAEQCSSTRDGLVGKKAGDLWMALR